MSMQEYFDKGVKMLRKATLENSPQITLGELIDLFSVGDFEEDCYVDFDFPNMIPSGMLDSWRGSYDELALGHCDYSRESLDYDEFKVVKLLQMLKEMVGKTLTGYKGGEYLMDRDTPVWVDNYSQANSTAIIGIEKHTDVEGKVYRVTILTSYCEY